MTEGLASFAPELLTLSEELSQWSTTCPEKSLFAFQLLYQFDSFSPDGFVNYSVLFCFLLCRVFRTCWSQIVKLGDPLPLVSLPIPVWKLLYCVLPTRRVRSPIHPHRAQAVCAEPLLLRAFGGLAMSPFRGHLLSGPMTLLQTALFMVTSVMLRVNRGNWSPHTRLILVKSLWHCVHEILLSSRGLGQCHSRPFVCGLSCSSFRVPLDMFSSSQIYVRVIWLLSV